MKDERYKQIMNDFGMSESSSLLSVLQQVANEVAQEKYERMWEPYQEKVFEEKRQLDEKISNLNMLLGGKHDISPKHLELLKQQFFTMKEYSEILHKRILNFKENADESRLDSSSTS